jgi:hypothetical protein
MSEPNESSTDERRAFLKGTLLAAGTVVASTAAAEAASSAEQADKLSNPMPGRSVHIAVKSGIQAKTVHAALDHFFELVGCPACGFNGILDFQIKVVGATISDRFGKEGVLGASENLGRF